MMSDSTTFGSTQIERSSKWDIARLRTMLRERAAPGNGIMVTLPTAAIECVVALRLAGSTPLFYWHPGLAAPGSELLTSPAILGWDAAAVLTADGNARFAQIEERAALLFATLGVASLHESGDLQDTPSALVEPRLFGGFSFHPGAALDPNWSGFHDANLVLPRWRYAVQEQERRAEIALTLTADELWNDRACGQWLIRLLDLNATLFELSRTEPSYQPARAIPAPSPEEVDADQTSLWNEQIDSILSAVHAGLCSKVVLARQRHLTFERPLSLPATLHALQHQAGDDTNCFAFAFGSGVFVGATPETLISKNGSLVVSEALAGSVHAEDQHGEQTLLSSSKDREEHRVVVQAIVDTLKPLCSRVSFDSEPSIRRLKHLLHLRTPISAELSKPCHVLDLVARLHPTPAVGGTPTDWAVAWITEHEDVPRGWYASPVGWFNAKGDGAFHVALRSGVLRDHDAFLYAGAGVVAGSQASSELIETELKLASLLDSLRTD